MSPSEFESRVAAALPATAHGTRVLVAVSGGADSVALLRVLRQIADSGSLQIVAAHLNHGLRGEESETDARWVESLCAQLGVPAEIDRIDIRDRSGESLEEAARNRRYEFLKTTARSYGCRFVAVAHTADDQVETVLHRILRGTGLAGLRGMESERPLRGEDKSGIRLLRPLLGLQRREVEDYLRGIGQDYRVDATNTDERFTRNRIRHRLLPFLREQFNPRVDEAILRLAEHAAETKQLVEFVCRRYLEQALLESSESACRVNCEALQDCPEVVTREVLRLLWQTAGWPQQGMSGADWKRLAALVDSDGAVTLPGNIDARRRGEMLVLRRTLD